MEPIRVCGVDPGIVNMAAWVGSYDPISHKVATTLLIKENIGAEKGKKSVQAGSAESALRVADECARGQGVEAAVVETAPQWNVPIRLSAATVYGVLRGRGVRDVRYSSPSTKASAIEFFAEKLGMSGELQRPAKGIDKLNKKTSAAVRLMNKRNAVAVVRRLLEFSGDAVGAAEFASDPAKQDDMADALLLACGTALCIRKEREKASKKEMVKKKKKKAKCGEPDISRHSP